MSRFRSAKLLVSLPLILAGCGDNSQLFQVNFDKYEDQAIGQYDDGGGRRGALACGIVKMFFTKEAEKKMFDPSHEIDMNSPDFNLPRSLVVVNGHVDQIATFSEKVSDTPIPLLERLGETVIKFEYGSVTCYFPVDQVNE